MFIKKHGRRCLLLHSYRDGRGKSCHRRLAHFADAAGLERALEDLPLRCPGLAGQVSKIRRQAQAHLDGTPPPASPEERAWKIRRAAGALLTYLTEESDEDVWETVASDLALVNARLLERLDEPDGIITERSRLSPRRRRFDASDQAARDYGQALDGKVEELQKDEKFAESATVLAERVKLCPTPESRLAYGLLLHKLDRFREARAQYELVPLSGPYRHLHTAAAFWREGLPTESMVHLLHGVTRLPEFRRIFFRAKRQLPADGQYWAEFRHLWTETGVEFAMGICSQMVVRTRLYKAIEARVQPRQLVPNFVLTWLIDRGLARARGSSKIAEDIPGHPRNR